MATSSRINTYPFLTLGRFIENLNKWLLLNEDKATPSQRKYIADANLYLRLVEYGMPDHEIKQLAGERQRRSLYCENDVLKNMYDVVKNMYDNSISKYPQEIRDILYELDVCDGIFKNQLRLEPCYCVKCIENGISDIIESEQVSKWTPEIVQSWLKLIVGIEPEEALKINIDGTKLIELEGDGIKIVQYCHEINLNKSSIDRMYWALSDSVWSDGLDCWMFKYADNPELDDTGCMFWKSS